MLVRSDMPVGPEIKDIKKPFVHNYILDYSFRFLIFSFILISIILTVFANENVTEYSRYNKATFYNSSVLMLLLTIILLIWWVAITNVDSLLCALILFILIPAISVLAAIDMWVLRRDP